MKFWQKVKLALHELESIHVDAIFSGEFKLFKNDEEVKEIKYFNTKGYTIFKSTDLKPLYETFVCEKVLHDIEEFEQKESGWALSSILNLTVLIKKYQPMHGGSSFIRLPDAIHDKRACVNVVNNDNKCFKWSILAGLQDPQPKNRSRVSNYEDDENKLNFSGIDFPVQPHQISKFEKQNDVSVNVLFLKKKGHDFDIATLHLSNEDKKNHVNLLYVQSKYLNEDDEWNVEKNGPIKYHYVLISDLSRLVSSKLNQHQHKKHICNRCLHYFSSKILLDRHLDDCKRLNKCRVILPPKEEAFIEFKNYKNKDICPIVVYSDYECYLERVENDNRVYQKHVPYSVGMFILYRFAPEKSRYISYRQKSVNDETPEKWFIRQLKDLHEEVEVMIRNIVPLSQWDEEVFQKEKVCHICEKEFTSDDRRVKDHCHITGRFRFVSFFSICCSKLLSDFNFQLQRSCP